MPPKVQSIENRNQATGLSEDVIRFFQGQAAGQLGAGTGLQRGIGTAIEQFINSGGMPFDVSPQADALQTIFAQDRTRGLNDIAEQFGIMGSRMGTPLGVGSARFLEGLIPRQENVLGDLFLRAHEGAANRLLSAFGIGNQTAAGMFSPYLQLGGQGILAPTTTVSENPWLTAGKSIAGLAGGIGTLGMGLGAGGLGFLGGGGGGGAPMITSGMAQATQPYGVLPPTVPLMNFSPDTL